MTLKVGGYIDHVIDKAICKSFIGWLRIIVLKGWEGALFWSLCDVFENETRGWWGFAEGDAIQMHN